MYGLYRRQLQTLWLCSLAEEYFSDSKVAADLWKLHTLFREEIVRRDACDKLYEKGEYTAQQLPHCYCDV